MHRLCERTKIGAPKNAWQMRHRMTSSREPAEPMRAEERVKAIMEPTSRFLVPKRAASQGVGGIPIAPATTAAVTTQVTWSRPTDRSPCIWGSSAVPMVVAKV